MRYRLRLGELVAAIPGILDATPTDAVVAASLNASGLPTCAMVIPRRVLLDEDGALVAAAVAAEMAGERAHLIVLISYADCDVRDGCPALEVLRLEMEFAATRVEALGVANGGWFRIGCRDPECCPPQGRQLPEVPEWLPGVVRDARARALAHACMDEREVEAWVRRAAAAEAWEEALDAGEVADAAQARRLAAALDDLRVRDWVVLTLLGASPDAADEALAGVDSGLVGDALDAALANALPRDAAWAERARAVVERVARAARGRRRRAATQTLAAVLEWWDGNLMAARERCDMALADDPGYRLAELVRIASSRGMAPGWTARTGHTAR